MIPPSKQKLQAKSEQHLDLSDPILYFHSFIFLDLDRIRVQRDYGTFWITPKNKQIYVYIFLTFLDGAVPMPADCSILSQLHFYTVKWS